MKFLLSLFLLLLIAFLGVVYLFHENQNSNPDVRKYVSTHNPHNPVPPLKYPLSSTLNSEYRESCEFLEAEGFGVHSDTPKSSENSKSRPGHSLPRGCDSPNNPNGRGKCRSSLKPSPRRSKSPTIISKKNQVLDLKEYLQPPDFRRPSPSTNEERTSHDNSHPNCKIFIKVSTSPRDSVNSRG
uniref:SPCP25A2.03_0 protein n=1 Tax=Fopius arisanus TaxID=64838 RepID=A0A0C9RPK2_9HYME